MKIIGALTRNSIFFNPPYEPYDRMGKEALALRDEFNALIKDKKIEFEEIKCLCGNDSFYLLADYERHGILQKIVMCERCGLIQSNPRMTPKTTDWFYGSDYYGKLYERIGDKATEQFILEESEQRPQKRYEFIKNNVDYGRVQSVLEIGCGGGWSLYPFFKDGKKVVGYDYGPALINAGRKLGMDLRVGTIENDPNEHGKYDLILMNHVMEHFLDPVATIRNLQKYLATGGALYIEVPKTEKFIIDILVNAHNYYFTHHTFLHYLGRAGLAPKALSEDRNPIGAQAGLFIKAPLGYSLPSLYHECERMKKIIAATERAHEWRNRIKNLSRSTGLYPLARGLAHLKRKITKKLSRGRTASAV